MPGRSSTVWNVAGGIAESAAPGTVKKRGNGRAPKPGFEVLEVWLAV